MKMIHIKEKREALGIQSGESTLMHNTGRCIYNQFTTGALIPVRHPNYGEPPRVEYGYNCPRCGSFIPATFSEEDKRKLDEIYGGDEAQQS